MPSFQWMELVMCMKQDWIVWEISIILGDLFIYRNSKCFTCTLNIEFFTISVFRFILIYM